MKALLLLPALATFPSLFAQDRTTMDSSRCSQFNQLILDNELICDKGTTVIKDDQKHYFSLDDQKCIFYELPGFEPENCGNSVVFSENGKMGILELSSGKKVIPAIYINMVKWNSRFFKCTNDPNSNALNPVYQLRDSVFFITSNGIPVPNLQFDVVTEDQAKELYRSISGMQSSPNSTAYKLAFPSQYFGEIMYYRNKGEIFMIEGIVRKMKVIEKYQFFIRKGRLQVVKVIREEEDEITSSCLFAYNGEKMVALKKKGTFPIELQFTINTEELKNKMRTLWVECLD